MSLRIKIQGGTPNSGKGLCSTCKHGTVVRGQNCQEITFCSGPFSRLGSGSVVPFRVAECADFHPSNMPWLHEMQDMAWIVEARRRGPSGFQSPDEPLEVKIKPPDGSGGNIAVPQSPVSK